MGPHRVNIINRLDLIASRSGSLNTKDQRQ